MDSNQVEGYVEGSRDIKECQEIAAKIKLRFITAKKKYGSAAMKNQGFSWRMFQNLRLYMTSGGIKAKQPKLDGLGP